MDTWFGKIPGEGHYNPLQYSCLEIARTEESGKLQSIWSHRVERDWGNLAYTHMHSSKALILGCSAFLMVQLSHPYMAIRKTITLPIQTFVGKVMSVFQYAVQVCHRFSSKEQVSFMLWLQSLSTVILESKKIKSLTISTFSHLIAMK